MSTPDEYIGLRAQRGEAAQRQTLYLGLGLGTGE